MTQYAIRAKLIAVVAIGDISTVGINISTTFDAV